MKSLGILGSTGSVGTQTLEIVRQYKDKFKVKLLSASKFSPTLISQINEFHPEFVYVATYDKNVNIDTGVKILYGEEGLKELSFLDIDLFINGIAGISGIKPTYYLLENNKKLATANKESIICLGEILRDRYNEIFPIDSEHSAIFQCLEDENKKNVKRIVLTASGGPFFKKPLSEFKNITVDEALNHPKWKMGKKITVDSATLMNKGLEVIEAHYLFDYEYEKIDVIIHPESIIHGMVEYIDGTILANMSNPDMKIPILYAMTYPERWKNNVDSLDFTQLSSLSFFKPDFEKFPLLKLAYEYGKKGSYYPIVLTVADEIAVNKFLRGEITFVKIPVLIEKIIESLNFKTPETIEDVINIIEETQKVADYIKV